MASPEAYVGALRWPGDDKDKRTGHEGNRGLTSADFVMPAQTGTLATKTIALATSVPYKLQLPATPVLPGRNKPLVPILPPLPEPAMATTNENAPPAGTRSDGAGRPFYDRQAAELKLLLKQRAQLEAQVASLDDRIYDKETEYLEDTPHGNIIVGFDAYTKGTGAAMGGRRRGGVNDSHRIFSNSSASSRNSSDTPAASAQSTPMAASAPTPVATSFAKTESTSNHVTPTSSTSANRMGASLKRTKKAGDADSDSEKDPKKARTGSVVTRK